METITLENLLKLSFNILESVAIIYIVYTVLKLQKKVKDIAENSCYTARKEFKNISPEISDIKIGRIEDPEEFFKKIFSSDNSTELTLEEQLKEALSDNQFERAAEIRDQITKRDQENDKK